jgi:hypothetical protein
VADLCPAISSGRSWVGMFAERSVSTPPAACCATPPSAPFSRLLPLRACISLLSVCPSLSLFCAWRAPAKMMRNAEISKNLKGTPLCAISKNLSGAPLRANRCREMPRGRRVFCVVLGPSSGLTMCKTHLIKPYNPPPFLVPSAISQRLGFGMRLPRIPYSSARHPYSAMSSPLTGVARAGGGRGSPFAWLLQRRSKALTRMRSCVHGPSCQ